MDEIQALAALVSILILLPSAIVFVLNQIAQLQLCMVYPELSLESGAPNRALTPSQRVQRDIMFEMLTLVYERAFLTYRDSWRSHWKRQRAGWEGYMGEYFARPDYLEWLRRVVFQDGQRELERGATQYDREFERHFFACVKDSCQAAKTGGSLDAFAPGGGEPRP